MPWGIRSAVAALVNSVFINEQENMAPAEKKKWVCFSPSHKLPPIHSEPVPRNGSKTLVKLKKCFKLLSFVNVD